MKKETFIGILIGTVITIICSFIFFILSNKKREPVYSVINSPSIIFDKTNSSPKIKILIDDSLSISENIYVNTLVFWNKGKLPINNEDIRKNFFIYCSDNNSKILDYKILEQKDSSISNFELFPVGNKLEIRWDYFDPQYGCKIQIIYSGNDDTKIEVTGSVLDSHVKQIRSTSKLLKRLSIAQLISIIVSILSLIALWIIYIKYPGFHSIIYEKKWILILMTIIVFLAFMYTIISNGNVFFAEKVPF